jgi:hypothetical protein
MKRKLNAPPFQQNKVRESLGIPLLPPQEAADEA